MPIDASIYGGIQQQRPVNRLAQLAQVMQLEGLQNQNDAAMYTRRKAEREDAEVNALNAAYRDAVGSDGAVDRKKLYQAVAAGGLGSRLPAIQKSFADADTATTNQRKAEFDLRKQTTEAVGQAFMGVMQNPTPENAAATIDLLGSRKYFTPQEVAEFRQIVSTNPQAIGPLAERMVRLTASVKDQTASFETRNLGGTTDTLRRDPITGKVVTVNSAQNTATPGDLLTDRRTREEGALNRGVTMRGQDLTDQRSRDQNNIEAGKRVQSGVEGLRKEFNALPEVKNYKEVLPIMQSVRNAPDTPAGDIDLIYGVGKVMDPNSVVREGEMGLVIKSGSPAQRLQGYLNYLKGNGRLTPEQRQELLAIMESRTAGLRANYANARKTYETAADRQGLPKDQVFIEPNDAGAVVSLDKLPGGGKPAGSPKVVDFGSLK